MCCMPRCCAGLHMPACDTGAKRRPHTPAAGHRWAQPSVGHLSEQMRHVVEHRQEAAARGRAARRRMAAQYSPDAVAEVVAQQLRRIERKLAT